MLSDLTLNGTSQARQIFGTCQKQIIVCSVKVKKKSVHFFLDIEGLNDVMRSQCLAKNLGTDLTLTLTPTCIKRHSYSYYMLLF